MSEINPFLVRDPRFNSFRFPSFQSVPGDTTANVQAPAPIVPAAPVGNPLNTIFSEDENGDDLGDFGGAGPTGPASGGGAGGISSPQSSGPFDVQGSVVSEQNPGLEQFGNTVSNIGKGVGIVSPTIGAILGLTGYGLSYAGRQGVEPSLVNTISQQGFSVTNPGFSATLTDAGSGAAGVSAEEAQGFSDVSDPDPGGFGADADAEAGDSDVGSEGGVGGAPGSDDTSDDPDAGAGGEGEGGAGEGPGGSSAGDDTGAADGDDAGDDDGGGGGGSGGEARSGGPITARAQDGRVNMNLHDGEFVLQTEVANAIGQDALNLINSGDFNPAALRQALGLPPQTTAAFALGADPTQIPGIPNEPGPIGALPGAPDVARGDETVPNRPAIYGLGVR